MYAVGTIVCSYYMWVEKGFIIGFGVTGCTILLAHILRNAVLYKDLGGFGVSIPFGGVSMIFFALVLAITRRLNLFWANRLVAADREQYFNVWNRILLDKRARDAISELHQIVQRVDSRTIFHEPRQYALAAGQQVHATEDNTENREVCGSSCHSSDQPIASSRRRRSSTVPFRFSRNGNTITDQGVELIPIASLDQLYSCAILCYPMLRSKVQEWALVSNGMFGAYRDDDFSSPFVRWVDAVADAHLRTRIKWADLKSSSRSIEKIARVYRMDVSRLLDVCRQAIIFESMGDLVRCLQAIEVDPDIHIVRLKNRFDPRMDARETAGFRNICLNVQLSNFDTIRLGLTNHVMEVQLLLSEFAEIRGAAGHQRYITYRDARAE
mmetsp:Transcript_47463/g.74169  ORF Transcript_47463/g.74169 Transcript_47463/m.74169 type:complete len:382 (+) Transcript_47463:1-1146(+)